MTRIQLSGDGDQRPHHSLLHAALSDLILGNFFQVHGELGPGYAESVYSKSLMVALIQAGLRVAREVPIKVYFRGVCVGLFRADLVVEDLILLDNKAMRQPDPEFEAQVLNYLRSTKLELGFLLYFNKKPSFKRLIYTNDRKILPPDEVLKELSAEKLLGEKLLGEKLLGEKLLGEKLLGEKLLDEKLLDEKLLDEKLLDEKLLDEKP